MNDTYLHLTLTHFPIVGSFIAFILLFSGYIQKSEGITKAALFLLVALALVTIVVNHTGEEAEEFVENMAGYSHEAIHEHEEMAEWAFRLMLATGLGAATALYMFRRKAQKTRLLVGLVLFLSLATCGLMVWAGKKGGEIRHTEVNSVSETNAPSENHAH
ncbi:hypothetical protein I5M27_04940 [Adhaeribacter sp. BT258]|uniref:DUF2231 domain-containing protein n=1 Tax=Adhaeribacter terrigena TaxID=2793070 RepID=A0ABS1BYT6_9BACT|nr:DUF2231 domain-containing protein [Adhaeribacter terrigena]MBK0402319.1 hypothetical protein [Adhaeribacter terrigena]